MYIGVKAVKPISDYNLLITFKNEEVRVFDVKPYLETGVFSELKDEKKFANVKVSFDTIEWENGADICPEVLYSESKKMEENNKVAEDEKKYNE